MVAEMPAGAAVIAKLQTSLTLLNVDAQWESPVLRGHHHPWEHPVVVVPVDNLQRYGSSCGEAGLGTGTGGTLLPGGLFHVLLCRFPGCCRCRCALPAPCSPQG